jgi:hypothetical protein
MKKLFTIALVLFSNVAFLYAQDSYVTPGNGYVAEDILPTQDMYSTFDIAGNYLYAHDGDTIHKLDMETGETLAKYGKPAGYGSYPSFLHVDEANNEMWAGFTVMDNSDDRIYHINITTGIWTKVATLAGNWDMVKMENNLLVSATIYGSPNSIYLLDTTGNDNHRAIIETTGSSAGISLDQSENLYYASYFGENDKLLRWSYWDVMAVIENESATSLLLTDAEKLSDLPAGAYDCDIDNANNVFISINDYTAEKVLAKWNGTLGDGLNYDTVAITDGDYDWFTMVKSKGNALNPGNENGVFTLSYGRPIVKVNGDNYAPVLTEEFETIMAFDITETIFVSMEGHFSDVDDTENFVYEVIGSSNANVANASFNEDNLHIELGEAGQTTITIKATNAGRSVNAKIIVGAYPEITGDYVVADFEDLGLEADSYWNGSTGEGEFTSGNSVFMNSYNSQYGYWGDWAYSSMSDNTTPGAENQYSAITGSGFEPTVSEGSTYGVSYPSGWGATVVKFNDNKAHEVKGFYVTNSTFAALSMKTGDAYAKKFGGATGNDPDWFKLSIWGHHNGTQTDTVEFYLADFTSQNNEEDYIIETWQWVELSSLGYVDSVQMRLSSSDVGQYGMNTPNYYCADNFYVGAAEVGIEDAMSSAIVSVYPNPTQNSITLQITSDKNYDVTVMDYTGKVVSQLSHVVNGQKLDLSDYANGLYILQLQNGEETITKRIIKQ